MSAVAVNAIRNLVLVLSLLAGICFVLAIAVATGQRLRAIAYVGVCLAVCGGLLLAAAGADRPRARRPAGAGLGADQPCRRPRGLAGRPTELRTAAIIMLVVGGVLLIGGARGRDRKRRRGPSAPAWQ